MHQQRDPVPRSAKRNFAGGATSPLGLNLLIHLPNGQAGGCPSKPQRTGRPEAAPPNLSDVIWRVRCTSCIKVKYRKSREPDMSVGCASPRSIERKKRCPGFRTWASGLNRSRHPCRPLQQPQSQRVTMVIAETTGLSEPATKARFNTPSSTLTGTSTV